MVTYETYKMSSSSSPRVACIWGANGISGTAMIDHLIEQSSNEWNHIICISRRPFQLNIKDNRIDFLSIDILNSTIDEIVNQLKTVNGQTISDVFHYTYIEKTDEDELDKINKIILEKTLDVCVKLAEKTIQSFSLQTGYKVDFFYMKFNFINYSF
jgi:actin-like ATPase involved in cell morphogenesis